MHTRKLRWAPLSVALLLLVGCPLPDPTALESECALLCDRTVLCTESHVAPEIAAGDSGDPDRWTCAFDDASGARSTCEAGCLDAGQSPTAAACIECLSEHMGCSTTGSMRTCDVDCEPTMFVTGQDYEGALEYDYASWFFEGVSELEGLTCTQD